MSGLFVIELTGPAAKDLKALSNVENEIITHLKTLASEPEEGHCLSQNLQGIRSLEFSIKGSGEYRAAYVVQMDVFKVTVFLIGTHENFYDKAAKRVKSLKSLVEKARNENKIKNLPKKIKN